MNGYLCPIFILAVMIFWVNDINRLRIWRVNPRWSNLKGVRLAPVEPQVADLGGRFRCERGAGKKSTEMEITLASGRFLLGKPEPQPNANTNSIISATFDSISAEFWPTCKFWQNNLNKDNISAFLHKVGKFRPGSCQWRVFPLRGATWSISIPSLTRFIWK